MKQLQDLTTAMLVMGLKIVLIFVAGLIPAMLFTGLFVLITPATFNDCVMSGPFWVLTVISWICFTFFTFQYDEDYYK